MFSYEEAIAEQNRLVEFRQRHYYKPDTSSKNNTETNETYEPKTQKSR